jgi:hypothetical protein
VVQEGARFRTRFGVQYAGTLRADPWSKSKAEHGS